MSDLARGLRYLPVAMPTWDVDILFVQDDDGTLYVPVRLTCQALGVADPKGQIEKLQGEDGYPEALVELPIPTAGGIQSAVCIRKREGALWVGSINPKKVKPTVRGKLAEFKQDLLAAADRLLFGDMSGNPALPAVVRQPRVLIDMDCPRCGAGWTYTIDENGGHLHLREDEPGK